MAWPQLENAEALVRNARHNGRFGGVRLPIVTVVSGFLWQLSSPVVALIWFVAMLLVERAATLLRERLSKGAMQYALAHLMSLTAMSALWVCFGLLLWRSDTELGRTAATIGLLTTALYGALGGQKDWRAGAILTTPPLIALFALVSWHAWSHWSVFEALVSTLATFGACVSVLAAARALNQSDATLARANRSLEQISARLADSMDLLEETSSLAEVGGWRLDLRTNQLEWTAQTRQIHEVDERFVPTLENALDFYTAESRPKFEAAVALAGETGQAWDMELQIRTARGNERWVRAVGRATIVDGVAINLHGVFADITSRVQLEEGLRQAQRLESVGRLAGGIAHDFNNVLTAVLNSADLLQTTKQDDPRYNKLVDTILKATERASSLTRGLLAFSRQQLLTPRPTDLNKAIAEAANLVSALIPSDIRLMLDFHSSEVTALLDPNQLNSALINLAVNAKDAMPAGGILRLSTKVESRAGAEFGVITVSDTGAGIDPAHLSQVFEPFFTTKSGDGGTGLGLSMVHGFVTQSGGEVAVQSSPGAGTTFTLTFPLMREHKEAPASSKPVGGKNGASVGLSILLVDDDELIRDALALSLRDKGHIVVTAPDGPRALQLYDEGVFDVVIADVVLTAQMSGPQLAEVLQERNPRLNTVLVSGYTHDKLTGTGRLAPGVSFLQKPFSIDALTAHLASLQVGSQASRATG
ncbi:hybrid sensor histidine kinase/response regulator [Candidatus Viadribacter manganicus]|uniref:histidine kinase n=1 Tax=Candidatus Viadribacter manganicus TaxID=1759059 RepID=A0A1B1AG29_9PROT|nr:ATP-binding protein [Candidatus Viadribacter manganicus]ANP45513.1 hypothetical protein ATE48_06060 [Candidatus Viadribacter manganicus]